MTNKFLSFLEAVGRDIRKGLHYLIPIAETAGEVAIATFAPSLGPLFNQTVNAVITAEQSFAAIGQQKGTGPQKLAAVLTLMGPLIKQALADVGKPNSDTEVQEYINAVVRILNALPAQLTEVQVSTAPASS